MKVKMTVPLNHAIFVLCIFALADCYKIGNFKHDGGQAKSSNVGSDGSLLISSLQSGISGDRQARSPQIGAGADDIEFTIQDDGGVDGGLRGFLQIKEAPPKLLEARQYGKTVLECSAAGSPAPRITWYKDGQEIVKDHSASMFSNFQQRNVGFEDALAETISHLNLDCVTENEAGYYECVATNSHGQKVSVGTEVSVASFGASTGCSNKLFGAYSHSAPKIYQWIGTYMHTIGLPAKLLCTASGKHKTAWYGPNEKQIIPSNKYKILPTGDLYIHELSFEDMGMFRCMVSNDFGHDMKETFVYPLAPMK